MIHTSSLVVRSLLDTSYFIRARNTSAQSASGLQLRALIVRLASSLR